MAPNQVRAGDEKRLCQLLYGDDDTKRKSNFKFQIGDTVRISQEKKVFKKATKLVGAKKFLQLLSDTHRNRPHMPLRMKMMRS